ncbi:MAG: EamA/RhaT family transporter [Firmicutes bacterium]|nr:EamA/RhaT family transporter [Bacillota bacterium]
MKTKKFNLSNGIGYIFAIISTILWAGNFVIARIIYEDITPITLSFLRWSIALIALLPFTYKKLIKNKKLILANIKYLSIVSFLGITLFNTLIYFGSHTTYASNLAVIIASSPVFIIILAKFFCNEKISLNKALGLIIALSGVLFIISKGNIKNLLAFSFTPGDIYALFAAIVFAIYNILVKKKPKEFDMETFLISTFLIGWGFLIPFYIGEKLSGSFITIDLTLILSLLYVGIFASLISFFSWNKTIDTLGPSKAAILYYLTPIFSNLAAGLFLNEDISYIHIISLGLIISGIIIGNHIKKSNFKSTDKFKKHN